MASDDKQLLTKIDLDWLGVQADEHGLPWLLMHSDDGVNWGVRRAGKWVLSWQVDPQVAPEFDPERVQQVRLFGEVGELLLWRSGAEWTSRWLGESDGVETRDDVHLLWGAEARALEEGFVSLNEGAEGLCHAPPAVKPNLKPAQERMVLRIRHHLDFDGDGQVYVKASRLVKLDVQPRGKGR